MATFSYNSDYGSYPVKISVGYYETNSNIPSLAIMLIDANDNNPVTTLTVNLPSKQPSFCMAHIDTNNASGAEAFLKESGLAKSLDFSAKSGFCSYPAYYFDAKKLAECDPEGFAAYRKAYEECDPDDVQEYYDGYEAEFSEQEESSSFRP